MTNELTRERIEKVKKNVCISLDSLADENGEVAKSHKDDLSTILALANAELERQSVTDEEIEGLAWKMETFDWYTVADRFDGHQFVSKKESLVPQERQLIASSLRAYQLGRELYKIAKRPNPDDLTETTIAQLTYDIERINTLRGDEWDYEPGAEEMRKELSAKYGHAINALMDYNKTVTVTWIGDPDDCPSAICSRCDRDLTIYDWYDKLVFGPRQYCPYCGGRIGKQVREGYTGDDEREEES